MHVAFDNISGEARVWIYQADRKLTAQEAKVLEQEAIAFSNQWAAHGQALESSAKVMYHQFLVLAVDEAAHGASGCSIDSSVHFVKQAEQQLGVSFFDRTKIAFVINDDVMLESLQNLKSSVEAGTITEQTLMFNNLVKTKEEMDNGWQVPAGSTWLSKYFVTV